MKNHSNTSWVYCQGKNTAWNYVSLHFFIAYNFIISSFEETFNLISKLNWNFLWHILSYLCQKTAKNRSSLIKDLLNGWFCTVLHICKHQLKIQYTIIYYIISMLVEDCALQRQKPNWVINVYYMSVIYFICMKWKCLAK